MLLLLHAAAIQPFATDTAQVLRNASHDGLVMTFPSNIDLTCNHEHVVLHTGLTCQL